jgi:hypothetical protein
MSADWHVHVAGAPRRRLSAEALEALVADGGLPMDALVWTEGMADWRAAREVFAEGANRTATPDGPGAPAPSVPNPAAGPSAAPRGLPLRAVALAVAASAVLSIWSFAWFDAAVQALRPVLPLATAHGTMVAAVILAAFAGVAATAVVWRHPTRRAGSPAAGLLLVVAGFAAVMEVAHATHLVLAGGDLYRTAEVLEDEEDAIVTVAGPGRIAIFGSIGPNFARDVLALAEDVGPLREIEISSPGGLVDQAMEVAAFIEANGVRVIVRDYCYSACVPLALSAEETLADAGAVFGFHRSTPVVDLQSDILRYSSEQVDVELDAYLLEHGVPDGVVTRARDYGPDDLLEISAEDLAAAGTIQGTLRSE